MSTSRKNNRDPVRENIHKIARMERLALKRRSVGDRISDIMTKAAGSTTFVMIHVVWFSVWIGLNTGAFPRYEPFDPFPFGLLTMIVSLEAIFLSLFILISQNRMTLQGDLRSHLDLQIDMLAEQEMTYLLKTVDAMAKKMGITEVHDKRVEQMLKDTNVDHMVARLEKDLPTIPTTPGNE